jgi:DNA-binding NtrC family response regulator
MVVAGARLLRHARHHGGARPVRFIDRPTPSATLYLMAHVLLVDDDNDLVEVLGVLLQMHGHEVRTASTGEEGLEVLRSAPLPDALVLDVDMPVLGGPGMAHDMLLHDAGEQCIPILLMSARHDLAEIAGRMGTPYFLAKPGSGDAILNLLDRALRERKAPLPPGGSDAAVAAHTITSASPSVPKLLR